LGECNSVVLKSGNTDGQTAEPVRWLRADLAASTKRCTLAYFHHPRFFSSISSTPGGGVNDYERAFWDVLYQAGAAIVLNGDQHHYERFAPQTPDGLLDFATGIREFVVGTGGADLSALTSIRAHSEVRNVATFGILKLTMSAGRYAR